uniref:CSON015123 protein n=1 Tax=Culicoides sonorensis TaxID=179676 RepID=A0A336MI82_CULSO
MTEVEKETTENINEMTEEDQENLDSKFVKHPLHHAWTLWYLEADRSKSWEEMQNIVTTFQTVEDFWSLFNHIKQPSEIKMGNDYSLFKEGDEVNKLWLDTVLCLIGEAFDHSDEICGAVVNVPVWTADGNNHEAILEIGRKLKERLGLGNKWQIHYNLHSDTQNKSGSQAKSIFVL